MGTTWAINAGLLGTLNFSRSALSEDGFSDLPGKHKNTFFKVFVSTISFPLTIPHPVPLGTDDLWICTRPLKRSRQV